MEPVRITLLVFFHLMILIDIIPCKWIIQRMDQLHERRGTRIILLVQPASAAIVPTHFLPHPLCDKQLDQFCLAVFSSLASNDTAAPSCKTQPIINIHTSTITIVVCTDSVV